jgi:hypothetical protein
LEEPVANGGTTRGTGTRDARIGRQAWVLLETVHSVTYFTPEARDAHRDAGLRGFWRGYFATRAAPLGRPGPGTVTAVFGGFARPMVERAVPEVWSLAPPEAALASRLAGAVAALQASAGDLAGGPSVDEAAGLLQRVIDGSETTGRPLGAANATLPRPDDPAGALWQAATTLRELRGDGHVVALVDEGLVGCAAHVLRAAGDGRPDLTRPNRGFTDDEWQRAEEELVGRGLVDRSGVLTRAGRRLRDHLEERTDRLAATGWGALDDGDHRRLVAALRPLATRLVGSAVTYPNAVGAPEPPTALDDD